MLEEWASMKDFATLFQYFWHRDFPIDQKAIGAHRADWTIHIGIIVRNVTDLIGFTTRFEMGSRKDAVLRSTEGDEVAIEWEWHDVLKWINTSRSELEKLKNHEVWPNGKERLKYAVLITYTDTPHIKEAYERIKEKWQDAQWPLLLIMIDFAKVKKKQYSSRREFKNIQMSVFHNGEHRELRSAKAFPWDVAGTTWSYRLNKNQPTS